MATPEEIAGIIKKHYPDAIVLLFGSRARGNHLATSDIDLIVVSKAFRGVGFLERPVQLLKLLYREGVEAPLDILCYTPEEFERKRREIGVVREALRTGVVL